MKKIIAVLLSALLALGLCASAQAEFIARVYNTESLNIRSGPGAAYAWLGSVARDGQVRVTGESGNWYRIVTMDGGITGYMSKNFLTPVENGYAQPTGTFAVVTGTETLNLRGGPGTEYSWLGKVEKGGWVEVTGESGNWYQVRTVEGGLSGYMSKNYLQTRSAQTVQGNQAVVSNPAGTRFLNLRQTPSYDAAILDIFYNGETCTVLNRQVDGWWYVAAVKNGQMLYGYFRSEYLSVQGQSGGSLGSYTVNTSLNGGNGGKLNLRARPSNGADSQVIRQIPNGAQVLALLKGNTWWQVEYEGAVGFVDSGFLNGGGGIAPVAGNAVVKTGNGGKLNLREQASQDSRILARYPNGTPVNVLQRGSAWCLVQVEGNTGYMMTQFLSVSGGTATKTVRNTNGGSYVNLRTSPEKQSGNVSLRVPDGAVVSLLSWGEEWSRVSYNGATGYMMSWFLK